MKPSTAAPAGPTAAPASPTAGLAYRWPRPWVAARPRVLGGAAATGLVTAVSLPVDGPGVGWLVGAATTVAFLAGSRSERPDAVRTGWAVATVLLAGVGSVRAAGWLFALCLLAAGVTGSLALTRGSGAFALAVRVGALPLGIVHAPRWARAGLVEAGRRTAPADRSAALRLAATAAVSVVLLVVFGSLLVGADPAFGEALDALVPDVPATGGAGRVLLFGLATLVALGGAAVLAAPFDVSGPEPAPTRVRRAEWAIPVGALVALFAAFVVVQVAVLFGGAGHVLGAGGPTYAGYARGGFWQLLAVTALTLAVLAAAARYAPRELPADRLLVRVLLGVLTALTLVIVASALHRMHTYEQAYGFTRLRVLVSVCEAWLGSVLLLVLAAGVRLRGRWVPEAAVATAVAALLGLAAANPDGLIADRNITRYSETGSVDLPYLSGLSADAVPALDRLPAPLRDCALSAVAARLGAAGDGWREANLGAARARTVLHGDPVGTASCP